MNHVRKLRSNGVFLFAALCTAAMLGMMPAGAAHAAVYEGTYTYEVADQSMWGSGPATAINYSNFFGATWDEGDRAGGYFLGTGGEVSAHTMGRIGLDVGASVDSGSVDISQQSNIRLTAPDVINSSQQLVVSSATLFGTGSISTQSPTASAYADLVVEVEADVTARGCVGGLCDDYSRTLVNWDVHSELLALNRNDDGQVRIFGVDSGLLPVTASVGPVSATLSLPNISTSGDAPPQPLESSGTSDFINLSVDAAGIASSITGVPLSGDLWPFSYTLLSAGLGLDLDVYQDFSFTANTPLITLDVAETGLSYSFLAGQDSPVIDPMGFDLLNISSTVDFSGILSNHTGLDLTPYLFADALSVSAFDYGVGPLFHWWGPIGTYDINFFDKDIPISFAGLDGPKFQVMISGDAPSPVPEPGTLVLLGSGLVSLVGFYGRRGHKREGFAQ